MEKKQTYIKIISLSLSLLSLFSLLSVPRVLAADPVELVQGDFIDGEVLVKYRSNEIDIKTDKGAKSADNLRSRRSLEKKKELKEQNAQLLRITDGKTVSQKITELERLPEVEHAEPNLKREISVINANDPYRDQLWGLDNIGQTVNGVRGTVDADIDAPEAWSFSEGEGVTIAVIDNGVDYGHPDLAANMWDGSACKDDVGNQLGGCLHGYDYKDNDNDPSPIKTEENYHHGTHVAGIIAAVKNNEQGVIGVAPKAKVMALKFGFDTASEIKAINFARQNGAKVINASYGGYGFSQLEYDAINKFRQSGGIFVAAAGNGGEDKIGDNNELTHFYPSDYDLDNIISVAATDQNDNLATFSNYGAKSVDVGAPGVNILSTIPGGLYGYSNGTSMATPHVAGEVGLIMSRESTESIIQIRGRLLNASEQTISLLGKIVSGKRVNSFLALLLNSSTFTIPVPIFRLYNTKNGAYLYTRGVVDRNYVLSKWPSFEFTDGVPAFYAPLSDPADGSVPIFRLYNTKNGAYLYTRGVVDRNYVLSKWPEFEFTDGIPAFYASLSDVGAVTPTE